MRKTLITLAATGAFLTLAPVTASFAATASPAPSAQARDDAIQQADWYCGPRCEYWRHRRWEEHRRWEWNRYHGYQYGYNDYYRRW